MGSFDPVHNGHCTLVKTALSEANSNGGSYFSKIVIVPAYKNPFKNTTTSFADRVTMLNLAFEDEIKKGLVEISTHELDIANNDETQRDLGVYGVESMAYVSNKYCSDKQNEIIFITTSETISEFDTWMSPSLLKSFKYFVYDITGMTKSEEDEISNKYEICNIVKLNVGKIHSKHLRKSSKSFRRKHLPKKVFDYIYLFNLYEVPRNWCYTINEGPHKGVTLWSGRTVAGCGITWKFNKNKEIMFLANLRGPGCPDYRGCWNLTCGYVEGNETILEAIVREIYEECSIKFTKDPEKIFSMVNIEDEPAYCNGSNITVRYMSCPIEENDYIVVDDNDRGGEFREVDDVKWINEHEIDNYKWAFNHYEILKNIIKKIHEQYNL